MLVLRNLACDSGREWLGEVGDKGVGLCGCENGQQLCLLLNYIGNLCELILSRE